TSTTSTGIASGGFDVKLTTTQANSPLSIAAPVTLGAGDLRSEERRVGKESGAGGMTAAGLQILGSGTVRLDSAVNNVTTIAANHTGTIRYTDDDSRTVSTDTDTAMLTSTTSTGIASGGFDVKLTTTQANSPLSIAAPVTLGAGDL